MEIESLTKTKTKEESEGKSLSRKANVGKKIKRRGVLVLREIVGGNFWDRGDWRGKLKIVIKRREKEPVFEPQMLIAGIKIILNFLGDGDSENGTIIECLK